MRRNVRSEDELRQKEREDDNKTTDYFKVHSQLLWHDVLNEANGPLERMKGDDCLQRACVCNARLRYSSMYYIRIVLVYNNDTRTTSIYIVRRRYV
jgi:hypothetical protein